MTLYMPDELRERAREANLNLSRILRDAVARQLDGERAIPAVELERVGDSLELRLSLPVETVRDEIGSQRPHG